MPTRPASWVSSLHFGPEAGERVALDEAGAAFGVAADVDAAGIAAAERPPGGEGDGGGFVGERAGGKRQLVEGFHLVAVGIGGGVAAGQEADFADADDARVGAGAEEADGEFAAGQEGFDQRRLAIACFSTSRHLRGEAGAVGDACWFPARPCWCLRRAA